MIGQERKGMRKVHSYNRLSNEVEYTLLAHNTTTVLKKEASSFVPILFI